MGRCAWFHCCRRDVDLGVALSSAGDSEGADNEGFTQEWFDEDFGLGHSRREAEELRLQQLQIEQEIQQLQQAQEQIPFFYIREIPNKPPPPYTPPRQESRNKQELRRRQVRAVPESQEEILALAAVATDSFHTAITNGTDLDLIQPPDKYYESENNDNRRVFQTFLFDLTREIVKDVHELNNTEWHPAWEKPTSSNKIRKIIPRSKEMLHEVVKKRILSYMGFTQKTSKENSTMSWGRKKRDFVDELLMREAHEEEESWTNYDEDETTLKNDIAVTILNNLIEDTIKVRRDIYERKSQRAALRQ